MISPIEKKKKNEKIKIIYVAGNYFSGSTILGLLLGSQPEIFDVGEAWQTRRILHLPSSEKERKIECTCGRPLDNCPFWKEVQQKTKPFAEHQARVLFPVSRIKQTWREFNPFIKEKKDPDYKKYAKAFLNPFSGLSKKIKPEKETSRFIQTLFQEARKQKKSTKYLVDTSKEIYPLFLLLNNPAVELYVIHLVKSPVAYADSKKKRYGGIKTRGILGWAIFGTLHWIRFNVRLHCFLIRTKVKHICINCESLYQDTEGLFKELNSFLGLSLDARDYVNEMRKENYHVLRGNGVVLEYVNKIKKKQDEFRGLYNKNKKMHLTRTERFIVAFITHPFSWVIKQKKQDKK